MSLLCVYLASSEKTFIFPW